MLLNLPELDVNEMEILLIEPCDTPMTHGSINLGSLAPYLKSSVGNLWVIFNKSQKLYSHINKVVRFVSSS